MTLTFLRFLAAVAIGVYLGLWFAYGAGAQQPEGAMGAYPVPAVVGMSGCAGYVLARGEIDAAPHELETGYAIIGAVTLVMPAQGVPVDIVRSLERRGVRVEIVLRELPALERMAR